LRRSYRAYGRVLASDLDFPELTPCDEPADITFHIDVLPQAPARWFDIWRFFEERPWVRASVCPDGYRIRYEEMADFFVNPARGVAIADPYACPPLTLRHFFLDQVLPLMLSVRDIVLHASAAAIDEKCVAFVGPGGSGKSTLALALGRLSFPVVSDDGLLVRQAGHDASSNGAQRPGLNWTAVPSYAGLRLWPDALEALAVGADARMVEHSPKGRLRDGVSFAAAPRPLASIYVLEPRPFGSVEFSAMSARDLLVAMLGQMYRLDQGSASGLGRELQRAGDCASSVRAWRLAYPRNWSCSRDVAYAVVEHARSHVIDSCSDASGRPVRDMSPARAC
jgi:energy-coupling factor transporter ATP-binding protein EcfA2